VAAVQAARGSRPCGLEPVACPVAASRPGTRLHWGVGLATSTRWAASPRPRSANPLAPVPPALRLKTRLRSGSDLAACKHARSPAFSLSASGLLATRHDLAASDPFTPVPSALRPPTRVRKDPAWRPANPLARSPSALRLPACWRPGHGPVACEPACSRTFGLAASGACAAVPRPCSLLTCSLPRPPPCGFRRARDQAPALRSANPLVPVPSALRLQARLRPGSDLVVLRPVAPGPRPCGPRTRLLVEPWTLRPADPIRARGPVLRPGGSPAAQAPALRRGLDPASGPGLAACRPDLRVGPDLSVETRLQPGLLALRLEGPGRDSPSGINPSPRRGVFKSCP